MISSVYVCILKAAEWLVKPSKETLKLGHVLHGLLIGFTSRSAAYDLQTYTLDHTSTDIVSLVQVNRQ